VNAMLPQDLKAEHFKAYPPDAKKLVTEYLAALASIPLVFLAGLLREAIEYDYKFPVERKALERELANLSTLSEEQKKEWFGGFAAIQLDGKLEKFDWVNAPGQFVEQLSAHLWATHQLDAFRQAAMEYAERLRAAIPPEPPAIPRLGITVIGQGVESYSEPLFRKLRPHGAYFTQVDPKNGLAILLEAVAKRAERSAAAYAHWYVDGGRAVACEPAITCVSYRQLEPARAALLAKMNEQIEKPGMGPEALRTMMARMQPEEVGLGKGDAVLDRFQLKVLTEGSGTQIFSTTFAQWTAREALRRAQPLTLLVRFAPRQRQKTMNELLAGTGNDAELDPLGSLVDGDMGAYYNWLNQQRLPGAEQSSFLAWFEGHREAVVISPATPRGTKSDTPADMRQLLSWVV